MAGLEERMWRIIGSPLARCHLGWQMDGLLTSRPNLCNGPMEGMTLRGNGPGLYTVEPRLGRGPERCCYCCYCYCTCAGGR
jgi:hypothetical protein